MAGHRGGERDRHCRYSRLVQSPLEQPDRLLAHGSGGHEEGEVHFLGPQPVEGGGDRPFQHVFSPGNEAHGGDHRGGERAHHAGLHEAAQRPYGHDDIGVGRRPPGVS